MSRKSEGGCRPLAAPSSAGFTLIELMVVVAIIGILAAIISGAFPWHNQCIDGYLYHTQADGTTTQVVGENGGGVVCRR